MDMNAFINLLLANDNPVLPDPTVIRVALHVLWAMVLCCGVLLLAGKLARPYRFGLSGLVMAWTLMPGPVSPAYWLGLAFQMPSLMSVAVGLLWVIRAVSMAPRSMAGAPVNLTPTSRLVMASNARGGQILALAGVVLGWVLLLDTLALLPVSVYAWGFSPAALGAVAVLAALLWAVSGDAGAHRTASGWAGPALVLSVLALFVLTRFPSGNVWDALIDPWLWLGLQGRWLFSGLRYLRSRRLPPTIPA